MRSIVTAVATAIALPPPPVRLTTGLRMMSPRDFAEFTYELYLAGRLNWAEYRMVGFPSELDPRFDETIGALTGERAAPDRPRDVLAEWQERVEFMHRFQAGSAATARAERILAVLEKCEAELLD